jgi:hypothetical protein
MKKKPSLIFADFGIHISVQCMVVRQYKGIHVSIEYRYSSEMCFKTRFFKKIFDSLLRSFKRGARATIKCGEHVFVLQVTSKSYSDKNL